MIEDTLIHICKIFNESKIIYGIGASVMLYYEGLDTSPNDIDIIVDKKDIKRAQRTMAALGLSKEMPPKEPFLTEYFYRYEVNGIEIDMFSRFMIKHSRGVYEYLFSKDSVTNKMIKEVNIPLTLIEDWYILYQLIPQKESKVKLIEEYFKDKGIERGEILSNSLNKNLPDHIKIRIKDLLNSI